MTRVASNFECTVLTKLSTKKTNPADLVDNYISLKRRGKELKPKKVRGGAALLSSRQALLALLSWHALLPSR